jgi:hypothetical protein
MDELANTSEVTAMLTDEETKYFGMWMEPTAVLNPAHLRWDYKLASQ